MDRTTKIVTKKLKKLKGGYELIKIKILSLLAVLVFLVTTLASAQVPNPELRGIPRNVTLTASTAVTSTPTEINGSALNRVGCTITNPNTSFDVRITFASATYTAKDLITAGICQIVPPGGTLTINGANYSPGPWTADWTYGKTMYADVSPTPLSVTIGFNAWKFYNTPAD